MLTTILRITIDFLIFKSRKIEQLIFTTEVIQNYIVLQQGNSFWAIIFIYRTAYTSWILSNIN